MSMQLLTVLQFLQQLLAYTAVTLCLPWIILQKKFRGFSVAEQLAGYFLAGNTYIIYLVFLLQFLHISGKITLWAGTILPLGIFLYRKYGRQCIYAGLKNGVLTFEQILTGEAKVKMLMFRGIRRLFSRKSQGLAGKILRILPELLLTGALIAGILYVYGTNTFTVFGYKASDLPVHNYWVNMMDDNKIFGAGVYPYGFHCIIYYLHQVFGIKTYILFRVFALVQTIFIMLSLLVSLKMLCKTRFAPYIGTGLYIMGNLFSVNTYNRFTATLPQEYGMLFIFPSAAFAIRFFQEYNQVRKAEEAAEKQRLLKKTKMYLLGFIFSFSLTLTVHFYNTMVAGIFCLSIAAGFCFRFFRWEYCRQILLAGIASILLALLPLLIGLAMGRGLEGSLYWGMKVINGTANEETTQQTQRTITDDKGNEVVVVGEVDDETLEKVKNGTIADGTDAGSTSEHSATGVVPPQKQTLGEKLRIKWMAALNQIRVYAFHDSMETVYLLLIGIGTVLLLGTISVFFGQRDYGGVLWSVGVFMILMCVMESLSVLGIPELMDVSRNSIFLCYSTGLLWAMALDGFIWLLTGWLQRFYLPSLVSFSVLLAISGIINNRQLFKSPVEKEGLESNEAITCLTNIIRENKDFTWTIVSANDELRMTEKFGYHYEVITMLDEMKDLSENPEITIPTDTVYFFVEKRPVNYAESANGLKLGKISEEYAREPLASTSGLTAYTGEERWVTMSHMYYWAEAFRKLFPNEMEVYEETEDFICYRLKQNGYSLYNLAIDYGYNEAS